MSNLSRFLKQNKTVKPNAKYAPTVSLTDENGKPLEWEFKHITSKENEELRDNCTMDVPITGKPNLFRQKFKTREYLARLVAASVAEPDLYNAELQDSYGVKTPTDLLYAMVDSPGEYQDLCAWVQSFQGFNETLEDKAEEAKKLIECGDGDANYAYYALHKLHIRPLEWVAMDENEKAFIIAAIQVRVETEKKKQRELENKK